MKTRLILSLSVVALFGAAVPAAPAQTSDLKQQMAQRLPSLDELRRSQIVGEANTGYLEVRGKKATPEAEQLVADENRDRAAVYEMIARSSETTKDAVGRARAKVIAAASASGVLVQDADGNWAAKR